MRISWIRIPIGTLAIIAAVTMLLMTGKAWAASSTAATAPGSNITRTSAINVPNHTTINHATLFQCPALNCNQGQVVSTNDDVWDKCWANQSTPWGGRWTIVHNAQNGHVGWMSSYFLWIQPDEGCHEPSRYRAYGNVTINTASLFQCPNVQCNQGVANPIDSLTIFCWALPYSPWGNAWYLVWNNSNGHVGWISGNFIRFEHSSPTDVLRCGGVM